MIRATFTARLSAAGADPEGRTIAGVAVPWNVQGTVSTGETVVFHPGSLSADGRPVLLRDHDRARPLGRVIDAVDTGVGLSATARVARTRDGDEALVLAAPPDQVLGMFSVGADPTDWHYDAAGVLHVLAADWQELSLLPIGAYAGALVSTVTATRHGGADMPAQVTTDPDQVDDDELDDVVLDDDTGDDVDQGEGAPGAGGLISAASARRRDTITASPARVPAVRPAAVPLRAGAARGETRPRDLTLPGLSGMISAGMRRGIGAAAIRARITAALTNVITTDIAGLVRPTYRTEIVGLIDPGMPLVRALAQRPLPASGMRIEYPVWTAPPKAYGKQATQKTQIPTGPVTLGVAGNDIETWAQGNDISFQALNRSDPSFIDAYLRAASVDAGIKYDTAVATALLAVARPATEGTSFVDNVKALFAALDPKLIPPGPMFLAMAYDVWTELIGVTGLDGPAFWSINLNMGDFTPSTSGNGGLFAFLDLNLPAGTMLLGSRIAAASYGGPDSSADVRVVDVSLLGVDIGVYFYACLAIEYPAAFAKLTVTPAAPLAEEPAADEAPDEAPAPTSSKSAK